MSLIQNFNMRDLLILGDTAWLCSSIYFPFSHMNGIFSLAYCLSLRSKTIFQPLLCLCGHRLSSTQQSVHGSSRNLLYEVVSFASCPFYPLCSLEWESVGWSIILFYEDVSYTQGTADWRAGRGQNPRGLCRTGLSQHPWIDSLWTFMWERNISLRSLLFDYFQLLRRKPNLDWYASPLRYESLSKHWNWFKGKQEQSIFKN